MTIRRDQANNWGENDAFNIMKHEQVITHLFRKLRDGKVTN